MPPIDIDKVLSDPLLIVAAVLLVVSPVLFLVALVKYFRTPSKAPFVIPHHEMDSPVPAPAEVKEPVEEHGMASMASLDPLPVAPTQPTAPAELPAPVRRAEPASEKTIVMPPGMAEMHSEMEIAFSQIKLLNKKVAALEKELGRLRDSAPADNGGSVPPQPL